MWKLNPAREGEIDVLADAPRSEYTSIRSAPDKTTFIVADFAIDEELAKELSKLTSVSPEVFKVLRVARRYNGARDVSFPGTDPPDSLVAEQVALDCAARQNEVAPAGSTQV